MSKIKILKAKRSGFCFGVRRAIKIAFKTAEKKRKVFTFGPLIHNPQVIQRLLEAGVVPTEDIDNSEIETLIIRTHGIPLDLRQRLSQRDINVVDATCPFVQKAQKYAKLLQEEGYQVVILGDKEHPEVKGLVSYGGKDAIVLGANYDIGTLTNKKKVGIVIQTTQPLSLLKKFINDILIFVKELKVYNTICNSTVLRQKETKEIAQKVDLMVVIGGKNSANTTQLAKLCVNSSVRTYHIETASELQEEWFKNISKVGVSAGASTPEWIINEVIERIRDIGGNGDNG
ncbi:MAG: 4-hydroxy-3-methylbut-2-enyl diphosphate reductase [Thermodesulfovibrionales bacterium]|nr:4-hydroxy-3-methylbut-2-enyl diphosphate reductase [Thermodesulfovibrionales bacterium]